MSIKRLSDKEVMDRLKECDELLAVYQEKIRPVANELARRKSEYVFKRKGRCGYRGELGCWEEGIDTVCLHIKDRENRKTLSALEDRVGNRPYVFQVKWLRKLAKAGIKNVHVGGHY